MYTILYNYNIRIITTNIIPQTIFHIPIIHNYIHNNIKMMMHPQSTNQTEVVQGKEHLTVIILGPVDSGKTSLVQAISQQLGNQQQNPANFQKFYLISHTFCNLQSKGVILIDGPNLLKQTSQLIMPDIAILVAPANPGQFQLGFQREGISFTLAKFAKLLGVQEMIVAVSKMGAIQWNKGRYDQIRDRVTTQLTKQYGFKKITCIPVDSLTKINLLSQIKQSWYDGPSLLGYLDHIQIGERNGPLRISVKDTYRDKGLWIQAKVISGTITQNQTTTLLPHRTEIKIQQIYSSNDERLPCAKAGQTIKLKISQDSKVDQQVIYKGCMICSNENVCQLSSQFKTKIKIFRLPQSQTLIASGYQCTINIHAISQKVSLQIQAEIDSESGKKFKATHLKPKQQGICIIHTENPICLQKYDLMPSLGRFILRDHEQIIGQGEVIGIKPAKQALKLKVKGEIKDRKVGRGDEKLQSIGQQNGQQNEQC